jgi:hypothetical protein
MSALAVTLHTEPPAAGGLLDTPAPRREDGAAALLARARMLRSQATKVHPVVADAYLRRAAELSLEAWARAVRGRPVAIDDVARAAHAA